MRFCLRLFLILGLGWAAFGPTQVQHSWALLAQLGCIDPFSLGQAQSNVLKKYKNHVFIKLKIVYIEINSDESDVEQMAETYMLKREYPKFKGN